MSPLAYQENQRRSPRYSTDIVLPHRISKESGSWNQARIKDISKTGLRMEVPGVTYADSERCTQSFVLQLAVPAMNKPGKALVISGKVMWSKVLCNGKREMGIELEELGEQDGYVLVDFIAYLLSEGKARSQTRRMLHLKMEKAS